MLLRFLSDIPVQFKSVASFLLSNCSSSVFYLDTSPLLDVILNRVEIMTIDGSFINTSQSILSLFMLNLSNSLCVYYTVRDPK